MEFMQIIVHIFSDVTDDMIDGDVLIDREKL